MREYAPAIIFLLLGAGVGTVFATINWLAGPRRKSQAKVDPYECGLPSDYTREQKHSVHYYRVAILFVIFDIEVVLLLPAAVILRDLGTFAVGAVGLFIVLLGVAFVYEWRRGVLNWR
jgi:NADH-quinone oxidoreductase subunit A